LLDADVYPLFGDVTWGVARNKSFGQIAGSEVVSQPIMNTNNLSKEFMPFDAYYSTKLKALGWTVDNSLAAGGPGASITAYKKGGKYIITSYTTNFKGGGPNEPVQCPCDITFSVFSN
jgi:hypothetical protein